MALKRCTKASIEVSSEASKWKLWNTVIYAALAVVLNRRAHKWWIVWKVEMCMFHGLDDLEWLRGGQLHLSQTSLLVSIPEPHPILMKHKLQAVRVTAGVTKGQCDVSVDGPLDRVLGAHLEPLQPQRETPQRPSSLRLRSQERLELPVVLTCSPSP